MAGWLVDSRVEAEGNHESTKIFGGIERRSAKLERNILTKELGVSLFVDGDTLHGKLEVVNSAHGLLEDADIVADTRGRKSGTSDVSNGRAIKIGGHNGEYGHITFVRFKCGKLMPVSGGLEIDNRTNTEA